MKKFYSLPGLGLAVVLIIVSFIFIQKSQDASNEYKEEKAKIAEILNFNDRLLSFEDWVFTERAWQERKAKMDVVLRKSNEKYEEAKSYGTYVLFACLGFALIVVLIYARSRMFFGITMALIFSGLVLLIEGIMNPALEISAFKEELTIKVQVDPNDFEAFRDMKEYIEDAVDELSGYTKYVRVIPIIGNSVADGVNDLIADGKEFMNKDENLEMKYDQVFPGRTYFYYQNKGIMDVIKLLWEHGNKPVAIAIGLFSVIVPMIKLLLSLIMLVAPVSRAKLLRKILAYISKWSMADVFVVGLFLAFLSFANMSTGVDMGSDILFGLYYFAGYVVISIFIGYSLDAAIKERINIQEEEQNKIEE